MMTLSGRMVTTRSGVPTLSDLALGLSRINRFGGQTLEPWSVAQHSLAVFAALGWRALPETEFYALVHDAHEVMTSDVPTTFKTRDLKRTQNRLDRRLYRECFRLPMPSRDVQAAVHTVDRAILVAEAHVLMPAENASMFAQLYGPAGLSDVDVVRNVLMSTRDPDEARRRWLASVVRIRLAQSLVVA